MTRSVRAARMRREEEGQMATRQGATQTARQTVRERGAEATRDLRRALNLPPDTSDGEILGTALARAAVREMARNPDFARYVRREYDELAVLRSPAPKPPPKPAPGGAGQREPLVALRHTGGKADVFAPPDPQQLMYVYGPDKLGRALQDFGMEKLKMAVDIIQQQHPGTKPASRTRKQDLIAYIVAHSPHDPSWTPR